MVTAPQDDSPQADSLRILTLTSAPTPMPLHVPFVHELEGFTVFRSRTGDDNAALYHLHVGYFANEQRARAAQEVVRKYYPFATIEKAPRSGLGSLDDTLNTEFRLLRGATARVVERVVARQRATQPNPQHYAVRLLRRAPGGSAQPIPRLPEFQAFSVYAVRANDDDGDCHDVRLGFFVDLVRARQFANSIRGHFPKAAVLPVSDREHARVIGLGRQPVVAARDITRAEAGTRLPTSASPSEPPSAAQASSP